MNTNASSSTAMSAATEAGSSRSYSTRLHVNIGARWKTFSISGDETLMEIANAFTEIDQIIQDVRLESKSLSMHLKGNMTLNQLKISAGDIIQIILQDESEEANFYSWILKSDDSNREQDIQSNLPLIDSGKVESIGDIKEIFKKHSKQAWPESRHHAHLFERRQLYYEDKLWELYRPLYDMEKSPDFKTMKGMKLRQSGYFELWPHWVCLEWGKWQEIGDDMEWPWGESKYEYWTTGIEVKSEQRKCIAVQLVSGGFLDIHTGKSYKNEQNLVRDTCTQLKYVTERRTFIAMIKERSCVKIRNPDLLELQIFERITSDKFPEIKEYPSEIWYEIIKSGKYWTNCSDELNRALVKKWNI